MRAVVEDPAALPPALYRRFVRRCQLRGMLPDHLVAGEPYLALNAVVLSRQDVADLRRLTELFARAFDAAGRALRGDVPRLIAMGFPWVAAELLAAEEPRAPVVGRFDFVQDVDCGWQLLEYNADTPSGIREAIVADRLVAELLPGARGLCRPSAGLSEMLVDAFDAAVADGAPLGLVTSAGELEDLSQIAFLAELLRPRLAARGVGIVVGDADNLRPGRRGAVLLGRQIASLYRLLPFEGMLGTPGFAALYDGVLSGRLALLNGLYGFLLQHKGVMAWLHEHADALAPELRAAVGQHLPATWPLESVPDDEPRAGLVAKQVFGREGEEVHFGADLTDADWTALRQRGGYVAQRRVPLAEFDAAVPTALGSCRWRGHATVGAFAVAGRFAGFYTRFGGKVITARSKWLATLGA